MDVKRLVDPRSSFAAKVALALLGTVGLLMAVMLLVVQAETRGQIELVTDRAVTRAEEAFEESEERRREQLARRARTVTDTRRTVALLEAAIEAGDTTFLANQVGYALQLTQFDTTSLTVLTDPRGAPILTFLGDKPLDGPDPAAVGPLSRQLLEEPNQELIGYRILEGRLYTVRAVILDLAGRVVGTAAFGQPIRDEDAEALGRVVGAQVCFVARDECVAGTALARAELASTMAGMAREGGRSMAEHRGDRWELVAQPLTADGPTEGWLAMAVPLEPVLAPFDRIRRTLALGSAGALVLALLLAFFISRGLTRPVRTLVDATRKVGRGEYGTRVPEDSADEIGQLAKSFNAMTEGLALKEQYRGVLDKVVSREVAEELLRDDVRLGGENRAVTVLFADIRGFTELTEGMEPQQVIGLLNETMERLSAAVEDAGGVVDKYVGDEVMAVFGAPLSQPHHVERAVRAALAMQQAVEALNRARRDRSEPETRIGVGIHTGEVVAGNMGSANRLNYTVLGETVNLAARLCAIADPAQVLVSTSIRDRLPDDVRVRPAGARDLKGFSRPVDVFELDSEADAAAARPAGHSASLTGLMVLGAALAGAAPAPAQSLPTLSELGLEWISADGAVQLGLSGRMDLEGYAPVGDEPPWIIPSASAFGAGRARLFTDLFVGSRLFVSTELRVDRGEEPRPGPWDVRFDQAFVRVGPFGPGFLQVGKFVSPFGAYPQRHHTGADAFIRPPLNYEYRTMVCAPKVPPSTGAFLAWKDDIPMDFRPIGAPPVWGAPYQWGAMVTGAAGPMDIRLAVMNSAPSSEPEFWGWDADRARHPSYVAHVGVRLSPALRVGGSYDRGPYLDPEVTGLPADGAYHDYLQELFAVEMAYAAGAWTVRAEAFADRWEVPNVAYDAWDYSYYVEAQRDLAAGAYGALRFGEIRFNELGNATGGIYGGDTSRQWDYGTRRLQLAGGYRLLRNVGVQAEYAFNRTDEPDGDPSDDLFSVQLWWTY